MINEGTGGVGSWRTSEDHPNDCITENGQDTEKSPGDLRRLIVPQTPMKNSKGVDNNFVCYKETPKKRELKKNDGNLGRINLI